MAKEKANSLSLSWLDSYDFSRKPQVCRDLHTCGFVCKEQNVDVTAFTYGKVWHASCNYIS